MQELLTNFEERRTARREHRLRDAAGATADTTAAYYGAGSRYTIYHLTIFTPLEAKYRLIRVIDDNMAMAWQ